MANQLFKIANTELVGINELIAATNFSKSVALPIPEIREGIIRNIRLILSFTGSGAVIAQDGRIYLFTVNPAVLANDAALAAAGADHLALLGTLPFVAADFDADVNGGMVFKQPDLIFTNQVDNLWVAVRLTTGLNSLAGDDELLNISMDIEILRSNK